MSPTVRAATADRPLWWEDTELPAGSDDDLPAEVDAVVVGGGYTGVTAARELARRGRTVIVLEKEQLGYGASTRNAGFVHPGLKASSARVLRYCQRSRRRDRDDARACAAPERRHTRSPL